jgi:hypothetical protein
MKSGEIWTWVPKYPHETDEAYRARRAAMLEALRLAQASVAARPEPRASWTLPPALRVTY